MMYDELLMRDSNSWMLADCAKAAPTACRSRYRERSSSSGVMCVVVTVLTRGAVTVVA